MDDKGAFDDNNRQTFFAQFLNLFFRLDKWIISRSHKQRTNKDLLQKEDGDIDNVCKEFINRMFVLSYKFEKIDSFLIEDSDSSIKILETGLNRMLLTYERLSSLKMPYPEEIEIREVLAYLLIEFSDYFNLCKSDVEQLFSKKERNRILMNSFQYQEESTRKAVKDLWNLPTRYKLIEQLGIIDMLTKGGMLKKKEQNFFLSQIMGVNNTTARKLIDGTNNGKTQPNEDEELDELKNRIELISKKGV